MKLVRSRVVRARRARLIAAHTMLMDAVLTVRGAFHEKKIRENIMVSAMFALGLYMAWYLFIEMAKACISRM